jgi:hypothetical protein
MKIDAHLQCGTEDFGVQRSGKSIRERDERKGLSSQTMTEVDSLLEFVGGHGRGARESETWLMKPCGEASYTGFERCMA